MQFMSSEKFWSVLHSLDYKLLLIPAMFLLLRVWTCLNGIFVVYLNHSPPQCISDILVYLAVSLQTAPHVFKEVSKFCIYCVLGI